MAGDKSIDASTGELIPEDNSLSTSEYILIFRRYTNVKK